MLLEKMKKNKKGFTLIELIVVVAILAIMAAIAVPSFVGLQTQAKDGVYTANASAIAGAINVFNAMQADDTKKIESGDVWGSISTDGSIAKTLNDSSLLPAFSGDDSTGSKGFQKVKFQSGVAIVDPAVKVS